MEKNYAVFPCKDINITQSYTGSYSHWTQSSSTNGVKSYPIDICWGDTYLMAPCKMKSVKMNGFWDDAGANVVNQVFFQSVDKVYLANGEYNYITILATHMDDWDYSSSLIGKTYERGENMVNQGTDGGVAAHLDVVVGVGQTSWWVQNSYGEWVLPNSRKPEDVFYIDNKYNNVINTQGILFKMIPSDAYLTLPTPVNRNEDANQIKVICGDNTLRVRTNHSIDSTIIGFAKPGIYNIVDIFNDGELIWYEVEPNKWFANAEGCTEYLPLVAIEEPIVDEQPIEEEKPQNEPLEEENKDDIYIRNKDKENPLVVFILWLFKTIGQLFKK